MEIHELIADVHNLRRHLSVLEVKYGVLSEDFHAAIMTGKLSRYDEYDETRADFCEWIGLHETLLRRLDAYRKQMQGRDVAAIIRARIGYG